MATTLDHIFERIEAKKADYQRYDFTQLENDSFKTFFDLAQELETIQEFYLLCVAIPKGFFGLDAWLYNINPRDSQFTLITSSASDEHPPRPVCVPDQTLCFTPHNTLIVPIRGKQLLIDQLPFQTVGNVIGLLEVGPADGFNPHHELFFEKYANRIGYNLHNRLLVEKNIEHLRFIKTLVADIEHNIIAPNIVYKLYIKNLDAAVKRLREAEESIKEYCPKKRGKPELEDVFSDLAEITRLLSGEVNAISKHHRNMSLFLETLLRRSHFDQGRLTLKTKKCNMRRDVVEPQLERFMERFTSLGIEVDSRLSGVPDEVYSSVVDVGMMAQVYANLFSNALKYAEEVETSSGERKKYITYGFQILTNHFGKGRDGYKYNVFSSGPHIAPDDWERIFEDQYRGSNVGGRPGSGHGLSFVKNVVEIHGGSVGYEPTAEGNNFYFILPKWENNNS
jgi:signal transduction histidine kinase